MSNPDLGNRHTCSTCETAFYDLHKSPPICPKCKTLQNQKGAPSQQTEKTIESSLDDEAESKNPGGDLENIDELDDASDIYSLSKPPETDTALFD